MTRDADYRMLGLPPHASPGDAREAYATLLQVWDPARFSGEARGMAIQRFHEIRVAYRQLCDADQRGDLAGGDSAVPALTARGVVKAALWSALLVAVAYFGA